MTRTVLSFVFVLVATAGAAVAQPIPADAPPEAVLKAVLELSDDQLRAILSLQTDRRDALVPLMEQIRERQHALESAMQSDAADATRVGELLIAIRGLARQAERHEANYRESVAAILTDAQRERVAIIHAIELAVHAAGALRHFGL